MADGERRKIATRGGEDYVQISTRVPKDLHRRARLAAIEGGVPFMEYVAEAVRKYLAAQAGGCHD